MITPNNRFPIVKAVAALLGILILSGITFTPCLQNNFVNFDDYAYIIENPLIRSLGSDNLKQIFTSFVGGNYHPLTILSFALEYHFVKLNPLLYHLNNVLLHIGNTALVFGLFWVLTKNIGTAALTGLLFSIHPLRVESVAWVTERKDVLFAFFYLAALFIYSKDGPKGRHRMAICFVLFILSLLSKAQAVTLPLAMLLIDFFKERRISKEHLWGKVLFFVTAFCFGILAVVAQKAIGSVDSVGGYSLVDKLIFVPYSLVFLLKKILLPTNLCCFYPYPIIIQQDIPLTAYLSPLIVIVLFAAIFKIRKRHAAVFWGFCFFLIHLAPVIKIIPVGSFMTADRYSYLGGIGIAFIFAHTINTLHHQAQRRHTKIGLGLLVTFCIATFALSTHARCYVWRDSLALWEDALAQYPKLCVGYNNRGMVLHEKHQYEQAIEEFTTAIQYYPGFARAYNNRGATYAAMGAYGLAIKDLTIAYQLEPKNLATLKNRAEAYAKNNDYPKAIRDFTSLLQYQPRSINTHTKIAILYAKQNDLNAAVAWLNRILAFAPRDAKTYYNRAIIYKHAGDYKRALADILKAQSLGEVIEDPLMFELMQANRP